MTALFGLILLLNGCEAVFTWSPFEALQRDPANLSPDQQEQYAQDVLASGDTDAMAEAYELIAALLEENPEDGELNLLAVDLAVGASGVGDIVSSLDPNDENADPDAILEGLNTDVLADISDHIEAAEAAGQEISDSQYVNAGAAIIAQSADEAGGFDNIDWENDPDVQQAQEYAELGGVDLESYFG